MLALIFAAALLQAATPQAPPPHVSPKPVPDTARGFAPVSYIVDDTAPKCARVTWQNPSGFVGIDTPPIAAIDDGSIAIKVKSETLNPEYAVGNVFGVRIVSTALVSQLQTKTPVSITWTVQSKKDTVKVTYPADPAAHCTGYAFIQDRTPAVPPPAPAAH